MARRRQRDDGTLARLAAMRDLLAVFGVRSYAYDPGVCGYYKATASALAVKIDLGEAEWVWLEPLLVELWTRRERDNMQESSTTEES